MSVFKKLKSGKDKVRDEKKMPKGAPLPEPEPVKQIDPRVGLESYRDFFTIKNYWKTIMRKTAEAGGLFMNKYLAEQPDKQALYAKLKNAPKPPPSDCSDPGFEAIALAYLKVFDDVITQVEEKPGDVQGACDRLSNVGKMHRTKVTGMDSTSFQAMEGPFLYMIQEVLQDRYNEKAENLFRKFFQFCLKYLVEGFNK